MSPISRWSRLSLALLLCGVLLAATPSTAQPPVRVTIKDDKPVVVEAAAPVDPTRHINIQYGGNMYIRLTVDNKTMHLGYIYTAFHIDGQVTQPGGGPGRIEANNLPLPRKPGARQRDGTYTVWTYNGLRITQTVEVVPSKPAVKGPGARRRLDAVVVRYLLENKDTRPHKIGTRVSMDTFWVDNDGCLFAAPTHPNKILDGIALSGKGMPEYVQVLQRPNLQNPGSVGHYTLALGSKFEPPNKVVVSRLGSIVNGWDIAPNPAMGDSMMGMFWEIKELAPGARRELAYGFGQGVATNPENEGKVEVALGGSFDPGKVFTVTAYVEDPIPGQSLTLELPPGMERVDGAEVQPVPPLSDDGNCLVMWRARVQRLGEFPLRVRSSNGVTYTKHITIAQGGDR
jgi:hypothetical protein